VSAFANFAITRVGYRGTTAATDQVAVEEPLEILIGKRNLTITMRTPGHDLELAVGFLFSEGLIKHSSEILAVKGEGNQVNIDFAGDTENLFKSQDRHFAMTSACGVCGKSTIESLHFKRCLPIPAGPFQIDALTLRRLPQELRDAQSVFNETGGLHAAALFDSAGHLELLREDIGRHNAVDKIIGAFLVKGRIPLHDRILLVSGRASFELVQKAAMAGIPILAAVGAPSSLAVETAQQFNMTLAGFVRHDRFNVYTGTGIQV
jgi:FdhD protein